MGRGSGSSRGSSSSGRGSSRSSWSSSRGSSRSSWNSSRSSRSHTTVIWHSSGYGNGGSIKTLIPIAFVLMFFGVIFLMVAVPSLFSGFDYGEVSAKCIDNDYVSGWYYSTYEYEVDGKEYKNRSQEGWEFPEAEGKFVTIYYSKDDPSRITEENPGVTTEDIVFVLVGLSCVAGGIGLIFLNKKRKAQNAQNQAEEIQDIGSETISSSTVPKKKCSYCGCKYNADQSDCPNCGASNN